jgi:hypothetical protein
VLLCRIQIGFLPEIFKPVKSMTTFQKVARPGALTWSGRSGAGDEKARARSFLAPSGQRGGSRLVRDRRGLEGRTGPAETSPPGLGLADGARSPLRPTKRPPTSALDSRQLTKTLRHANRSFQHS